MTLICPFFLNNNNISFQFRLRSKRVEICSNSLVDFRKRASNKADDIVCIKYNNLNKNVYSIIK